MGYGARSASAFLQAEVLQIAEAQTKTIFLVCVDWMNKSVLPLLLFLNWVKEKIDFLEFLERSS